MIFLKSQMQNLFLVSDEVILVLGVPPYCVSHLLDGEITIQVSH